MYKTVGKEKIPDEIIIYTLFNFWDYVFSRYTSFPEITYRKLILIINKGIGDNLLCTFA